MELIDAIKRFYSYQDYKDKSTKIHLEEIRKYIKTNYPELEVDLIKQVRDFGGSYKFMVYLQRKDIIVSGRNNCSCNGGIWRRR